MFVGQCSHSLVAKAHLFLLCFLFSWLLDPSGAKNMRHNPVASVEDRLVSNIVFNHDFSGGLEHWHPNACEAFVVSSEPLDSYTMSEFSNRGYAVVTNRRECWQGLEQDITARVFPGSMYTLSACVGVSGPVQAPAEVLATLKLENYGSDTQYLFIGKTYVSRDRWEMLEGMFSLPSMPDRVVFFLEGPAPGVDLLVHTVTIKCSDSSDYEEMKQNATASRIFPPTPNIIRNHDFSDELHYWHPNNCDAFVVRTKASNFGPISESSGVHYAVVTNRKESWQGLEQDITGQVSPGSLYKVSAGVRVSGSIQGSVEVLATLKLEHQNSATEYQFIGKTYASKDRWENLEGTFSLSRSPDQVVFYLEGPPPGIDLLIQSVRIHDESLNQFERPREGCLTTETDNTFLRPREVCLTTYADNVFLNSSFNNGLTHWSGRGCKIMLHESVADGRVKPLSGKVFASATERMHNWSGIQQEITGRVQRKLVYEASAVVQILSRDKAGATVQATVYVQNLDQREEYIGIASVQANHDNWVQLKGKFVLHGFPARVVVYIEGPPPGTDIFVDNFVVKLAEKIPPSLRPCVEGHPFGANIVLNSHLSNGTIDGWFPLGNCQLRVKEGSPRMLPPLARDSLGRDGRLNGRCILVTNRTESWMGPAQLITDRLKLFLTYQVSAWVKIGSGATVPQNVNVALSVDYQWVNGGMVEVNDGKWHEIAGSFRIEKQPREVMLHVQGPSPGVEIMVAGLQIFAVDREARLDYLRKQADKVRKRDALLKFSGASSSELSDAMVKIRQTHNSFPLGACISRSSIDNEDIVDFFVQNFNWAVFSNEMKWYWTEPQQGNFNYHDADDMLRFCESYNIKTRGHCIFWEVESAVHSWVQQLSNGELRAAIQNRLTGLLNRYQGKFRHYDINNEMLHGSFYQERLGSEIRANMFKIAHQIDPSATLFVNEYHVEDGFDSRSGPEKYIELICDLQKRGAPVGGIGIQGHISSPVGPIICSALDRISTLGLPIWFTELDVSSINEHVRGDDLEVMLWEAYAHPAVEGIMLWGFWELFMSRTHSHLVNADGTLNEAGKRFLAIKREWFSHADGHIDDRREFRFRGCQGTYTVEVVTSTKRYLKNFIVDQGDSPLVIYIDLND